MGVQFERIQFTPDLLPSDVVGTMVFQPKTGEFSPHRGPVFANLVLADEINRAPAKVQSALLEAMQERQVTIGGQTHPLPSPFFVMATQNPIEQEGTYPLPEAQTDRFLFKLLVGYPSAGEEASMMQRWGQITQQPTLKAVSSGDELLSLRSEVDRVHVSPVVQNYILTLVRATRTLSENPDASSRRLNFGASPRASLALYQAGRALAWLRGLDYLSPTLVPVSYTHLDVYKRQAPFMATASLEIFACWRLSCAASAWLRTASINSATSGGLRMYWFAPPTMACCAVESIPYPVRIITET